MPKLAPLPLYLLLSFFTSLLFSLIFVAASFYEVKVVGLNGLQLALSGTTLEVTILLFEIPTGVIADVYSRRLSIIIGYFTMGLGFLLEGLFPVFGAVLLASGLWGLGFTFTSGATQAWLSDELGEKTANQALLKGNQADLAGAFVGMLLAAPLGNWMVKAPIVTGGLGLLVFGFFLALAMPETRFAPTRAEDRNTFQHMVDIFRRGAQTLRSRPALRAILGVGLVFGLYSEGWDRLWVKHLLDSFSLPNLFGFNEIAFFSLLRAAGILLSLLLTRQMEKRLDTAHAPSLAKGLFWLTALLGLVVIGFTFAPWLPLAATAILLVSLARNLIAPLYDAWVNQRLDSDTRATVISMSGQVDALGQIASGPLAGAVSLWSVQAAIRFAGLLLSPALWLIARAETAASLQAENAPPKETP